jgi:hypothetical protein
VIDHKTFQRDFMVFQSLASIAKESLSIHPGPPFFKRQWVFRGRRESGLGNRPRRLTFSKMHAPEHWIPWARANAGTRHSRGKLTVRVASRALLLKWFDRCDFKSQDQMRPESPMALSPQSGRLPNAMIAIKEPVEFPHCCLRRIAPLLPRAETHCKANCLAMLHTCAVRLNAAGEV